MHFMTMCENCIIFCCLQTLRSSGWQQNLIFIRISTRWSKWKLLLLLLDMNDTWLIDWEMRCERSEILCSVSLMSNQTVSEWDEPFVYLLKTGLWLKCGASEPPWDLGFCKAASLILGVLFLGAIIESKDLSQVQWSLLEWLRVNCIREICHFNYCIYWAVINSSTEDHHLLFLNNGVKLIPSDTLDENLMPK